LARSTTIVDAHTSVSSERSETRRRRVGALLGKRTDADLLVEIDGTI
jgi:hypothetical protein